MTNEQLLAKRNAELEKELAAQNRELEIEAALEKVRSRSLAMHKSDELKEVVDIVSDKMNELGVVIDGSVTIKIISEGSKDFIHWSAAPHLLSSATKYEVPYFDHPIFNDFWAARENGLDFFAKAYPFEIKNTFFEYLFEHSDYKKIPDEVKKLVLENDSYAWSIAFYKHSGIYIDSISGKLLSEQGIEILKRFARVFEQAYIRFLDLQRAESQARENQIQLALERARAQSMLMQHSTELDDTLRVFHEQVLQLGIPSAFSFLWLPDDEKDRHIFWAAWAENNSTIFKSKAINYPLDRNEPATAQCLIDWKSDEPVVAYHVPPPSVKDYFAAWSELIAGVEELKPENFNDGLYYVEAFMKYGCFGVMVKNILPEDEKKILGRFAVEFERAYTRFLDLQKAEAQAREAEIELALERVRAKTMAMQKSDELKDAAALLFQQVKTLGVPAYSCGFNIWEENEKTFTSWMSIQDGSDFNAIQNIPLTEDANFIHYVKSKQEGEQFYVLELRGERMQEHYRYLKTIPAFKAGFDYAESVGFDLPKTQIHHLANFSHGNLLFITLEPCPEFHDVFKRFAAVFEQTYTRFLDLQKAEAHAREAQIELALERVRGRTMAMHKSEELLEIMAVMFEQLAQLQLRTDAITLSLEYKTKLLNLWMAIPGQTYPAELKIPYINIPFVNSAMKAVRSGDNFYSITCGLEEKNRWIHHLFEHTIVKNTPEARKLFLLQAPGLALSMAMGKNIALLVANYAAIPFSAEENAIIKRFVNVFEQSYTRFLDLQKAEAQAREAQIETALERVRSRSLAMHKSDELQEVVHTVFEKLKELNVDLYTAIIFIFAEGSKDIVWWLANKVNQQYARILVPYADIHYLKNLFDAKESGKDFFSATYSFEEKNELFHHLFEHTDFRYVPEPQKKFLLETELATMSVALAKNTGINITSYSRKSFSESDNEILKRFAKVFDQAYIRFLDLQKAEVQAREAQIELSLERVRPKTMAMHNSADVGETAAVMVEELKKLAIETIRCGIGIMHEPGDMEVWTISTDENNKTDIIIGWLDMNMHPLLHGAFESWRNKIESYSYELKDEDLLSYYNAINNYPGYPIRYDTKDLPRLIHHNEFHFAEGTLFAFSLEQLSEEQRKIFKRFAGVFGQTYRRYLDLKKAEAQAREAQIEAALERVRSKAMMMQKSEDLSGAVAIVFDELNKLSIGLVRCGIGILHKDKRTADVFTTTISDDNSTIQVSGDESMDIHPLLHNAFEAWLQQQDYEYELKGEDLSSYYTALTHVNFTLPLSQSLISTNENARQYYYNAMFVFGGLFAFSDAPISDSTRKIMKRFANVFEQTYTRFLDIKKAEAQAREAKIETALERVRSSTMAMHKSEDLAKTAVILFAQLRVLGNTPDRISIGIIDEPAGIADMWLTDQSGNEIDSRFILDLNEKTTIQKLVIGWKAGLKSMIVDLTGEDLKTWLNYVREIGLVVKDEHFKNRRVHNVAFFTHGWLNISVLEPLSPDMMNILERFAAVYSLTYRRFLDLQKAEAQAREATIEAALEKVRGRAIAMHNSSDLSSTASLVFTELRKLGINPIRCGVGLLNKESRKAQLYSATSSANGDSLSLVGWVQLETHPVLEKIYDSWLNNEDYFPELHGKQLQSYYQLLLAGLPVSVTDFANEQKQYGHFVSFSVGCLYAWSDVHYNEDQVKIFKRFATIIDLTFRRYLELQKAETNAREAVKQAALDRIRADIASMRTVNDLDRITPLIWNELTILGIPFKRCGVFIMDETKELIHTFLSTPDGKAIGAFHIPYTTPGNIQHVLTHWQQRQNYIDHWNESDFREFANTLVQEIGPASSEQYLQTIPHGGFYLHFLPFLQGMLYVGNTIELSKDNIQLIQSVADAFSTAYARYEDFNKLEAAKKQVDSALNKLQETQKQLIQSEKMASLGELTAGIAHEIQNPLNFVNNFSEVNQEMIDELQNELKSGNIEEAIAISNEIKDNEEKIKHHGKRADAIVKGMLQHSRKSEGVKEPTDINALCDEYLRLSYHGLRAKDKSFNADFKTDFDNSIGKINIIPQDIGRVLLNLFNNAFYAVKHPNPLKGEQYKPLVSVRTRKITPLQGMGAKVEICVSDNGNGIPQNIIDKILQPFFTTKPTGQGTGLGLSLSYDIIKAHGGELKVESKEGEGSEFVIQLPA